MSQNHLPPNSDFSSDFVHFILEILENMTILAKIQKISINMAISGGDIDPEFRTAGTRPRHPPPPDGDAHENALAYYR